MKTHRLQLSLEVVTGKGLQKYLLTSISFTRSFCGTRGCDPLFVPATEVISTNHLLIYLDSDAFGLPDLKVPSNLVPPETSGSQTSVCITVARWGRRIPGWQDPTSERLTLSVPGGTVAGGLSALSAVGFHYRKAVTTGRNWDCEALDNDQKMLSPG